MLAQILSPAVVPDPLRLKVLTSGLVGVKVPEVPLPPTEMRIFPVVLVIDPELGAVLVPVALNSAPSGVVPSLPLSETQPPSAAGLLPPLHARETVWEPVAGLSSRYQRTFEAFVSQFCPVPNAVIATLL